MLVETRRARSPERPPSPASRSRASESAPAPAAAAPETHRRDLHAGHRPERLDAAVEDRRRREGLPPGRRAGARTSSRPGSRSTAGATTAATPGPTIEAVEGDRVRIYVTNRLPEPTTVHWHGIFLPNGMDGVAGLTQPPIQPGETFKYEFTLRQHGHVHVPPALRRDDADGAGHDGHVRRPPAQPRRRRASTATSSLMLQRVEHRARRAPPDPTAMTDFNVLTFNGKAFPGTAPLVVRARRPRAHPPRQPERDGPPPDPPPRPTVPGRRHRRRPDPRRPRSGRRPRCSCRSAPRATSSSSPTRPATGPFHCHMTHHVMNQMGHGLPEHDRRRRRARSTAQVQRAPARLHDDGRRPAWATWRDMEHGRARRTASRCSAARARSATSTWAACSRSSRCATSSPATTIPGWYAHPAGHRRRRGHRRGAPDGRDRGVMYHVERTCDV